MELLEFEEEEEINAPSDIDDDDISDNTDLFCQEDEEEDKDLCSNCDENPIAHLVQPCGLIVCTNCVKKNNSQLCGFRKYMQVKASAEDPKNENNASHESPNSQPNLTVVSSNSPSELTGDTEIVFATSGGRLVSICICESEDCSEISSPFFYSFLTI